MRSVATACAACAEASGPRANASASQREPSADKSKTNYGVIWWGNSATN